MKSVPRIVILVVLNLFVASFVIIYAGKNTKVKSNLTGIEIWRSKNCQACHAIYGLGGHLGPDLTNVYSRKKEAYLDVVLKNGLLNMPNLELSKYERKQLIKYLNEVDKTGVYPLHHITDNPFGIQK